MPARPSVPTINAKFQSDRNLTLPGRGHNADFFEVVSKYIVNEHDIFECTWNLDTIDIGIMHPGQLRYNAADLKC